MTEKITTTAETVAAESSGNTKPELKIRSRAFLFTVHEIEKYENIKNHFINLKSCDYLISCLETCPTTGKQHMHVYVHMKSSYILPKKILSLKQHIDCCKGSPQQNIAYVKKDGNIIDEWGTEPHQGFHTVKELSELADPSDLPWNAYNTWTKIHDKPKKIKISEWHKDVEVVYIQGPSGCGKSQKVKELITAENKDAEIEEIKYENGFYNGVVDGTGIAIYDDFRDSHMRASEFVNFIDYNTHNMNIKGGSVRNQYNKIFITSVQDINCIYANMSDEPRKQWMRRVKVINMFPPSNSIDLCD